MEFNIGDLSQMNFDEKYVKQLEVDNEHLESVIDRLERDIITLRGFDPNDSLKSLKQRLSATQMSCQLIASKIHDVVMREFEFIDHWKMISVSTFISDVVYNKELDFAIFYRYDKKLPSDFSHLADVRICVGYVPEWNIQGYEAVTLVPLTHYKIEDSWFKRKKHHVLGNNIKKGMCMIMEYLDRIDNLNKFPDHFKKLVQDD